jgi:hypothetical protein
MVPISERVSEGGDLYNLRGMLSAVRCSATGGFVADNIFHQGFMLSY